MLKRRFSSLFTIFFILLFSISATAQTAAGNSTSFMIYGIVAVAALLFLAVIVFVSDNLLMIQAKRMGIDDDGSNYSIFPKGADNTEGDFVEGAVPVKDGELHTLKQGYDIPLQGIAENVIADDIQVNTFAIQPTNFKGISPIPKVVVEVGDEVRAGDHLFFDKKNPDVKYVAPVSGEIIAINRGAKRAITDVVILADKEQKFRSFDVPNYETCDRKELVDFLLDSGAWVHFTQRPFGVTPGVNDIPENIFISTFDTAPLAPDLDFIIDGNGEAFQRGLDVLTKLTPGQVHLGMDGRVGPKNPYVSPVYKEAKNVRKHWFTGQHPIGNVGVQIHHVDPITPASKVWTLSVQDVLTIGDLFLIGQYNAKRTIALTGAELGKPRYVETYIGAKIEDLLKGQIESENTRIIAGDVLSGRTKTTEGYLNFHDDQITVMAEGNEVAFLGWLNPFKGKPSISKTYPTGLFGDMKYKADTNTNGERRAFVVTGQYEKVLPMDIMPQALMKAILANDFERMEGLGIHELVEEDIAICEFVCTSKQPLQKILRQGLDFVQEQG